jgi:hypothetical protein
MEQMTTKRAQMTHVASFGPLVSSFFDVLLIPTDDYYIDYDYYDYE